MFGTQLREYQRSVRRKLKEQEQALSEDFDLTLRLQGELKAINKIVKWHRKTYLDKPTILERVYGSMQ